MKKLLSKNIKIILAIVIIFGAVVFFGRNIFALSPIQIDIGANKTTIDPGETVTISYEAQKTNGFGGGGPITCQIPGNENAPSQGSFEVTPAATTTYTITCSDVIHTNTASIGITVNVYDLYLSTEPVPPTIAPGNSVKIYYYTIRLDKCTAPSQIVGKTEGFITVSPATTTTYTFTCVNEAKQITKTKQITVTVDPNLPITINTNLTANNVQAGGHATVIYSGIGATMCSDPINGSAGAQNRSFTVAPMVTTTYAIRCWNSINKKEATKDVTVSVYGGNDLVTKNAQFITHNEAVLYGSLTPSVLDTDSASAYFRYSPIAPGGISPIFCNDVFGTKMKATNEEKVYGNETKTVHTLITDLAPNTTYYFCLVASNENRIAYGGVNYFTTDPAPGSGNNNISSDLFVTTNEALPLNKQEAYINGYFNTLVPATTWFEYRLASAPEQNGSSSSSASQNIVSHLKNFFFEKAEATTSTGNQAQAGWKKIGEKSHSANSNGDISHKLTGLVPGGKYQYRAAIKSNSSSDTAYGMIKVFTLPLSGVDSGDTGTGGITYTDPCNDPADINCNGTGSGTVGGELSKLPDLTASGVTPTGLIVNVPTVLTSYIMNKGGKSTAYIPKVAPKSIQNTTAIKNIVSYFKTKIIQAATTTTPPTAQQGLFYGFFQVATANPKVDVNTGSNNSTDSVKNDSATKNTNATGATSSWNNNRTKSSGTGTIKTIVPVHTVFPTTSGIQSSLWISPALAASTIGNAVNSTTAIPPTGNIINLDPILMQPLAAKTSSPMTQVNTFTVPGNYYMRACADKKNPADKGQIIEAYENNNCGPWTPIVVSLAGTGNDTGNGTGTGTGTGTGNGNGTGDTGYDYSNNNYDNLTLGQVIAPPVDAIVRYHEGIEHVFVRQIMANSELATRYGYQSGMSLENFAWNLADLLARTFGYVGDNGKEIRVSYPDIAAYQLRLNGNTLTVYEYYDNTIVNIENTTTALRGKYHYEYYFNKK